MRLDLYPLREVYTFVWRVERVYNQEVDGRSRLRGSDHEAALRSVGAGYEALDCGALAVGGCASGHLVIHLVGNLGQSFYERAEHVWV